MAQTSLSTLEKWADPLREHKLLVFKGRWGDWNRWGADRSLWYCSLALEDDMEEGWGAPGVEEMTDGDETDEEDVGGGTWMG